MQPRSPEFYRSLPKVDLHRHLEGSLRLVTLLEVARAYELDLSGTDRLRPMVQIDQTDPLNSKNFLSKFDTLREFFRSPEVIARLTEEAIADAAADNIRYLELRFTLVALSKVEGFPLDEVMDWVIPYGKGRVYVTMLGHLWKGKPDTALRCIGFQTTLIRGCEWAATGEVSYPGPEDFPTAAEMRVRAQATNTIPPSESSKL